MFILSSSFLRKSPASPSGATRHGGKLNGYGQGLTTPFLTLITNLLYTQPLLLPSLLRALSQLVSSTRRLATSSAPSLELRKQFGVDQTSAQENLEHLKGLAKDMVSVLMNVFSKMPRESRGMVNEVIGLWVGIMSEKVGPSCFSPLQATESKADE